MKPFFLAQPSQLDLFLTPNLNIAFTALVVYDTLLTMDREVAFFWKRPKTIKELAAAILYFLNRYSAFVSTFASIIMIALDNVSPSLCKTATTVATSAIVIGTVASERILTLRTSAIWGHPLWIKLVFGILALAIGAISTVLLVFSNKALQFGKFRGPEHTLGCRIVDASDSSHVIPYFLLALYDSVIVALTIVKAYQHLLVSGSETKWIKHMYAQGIGFYLIIFVVSIFNALLPFIAPANFRTALTVPQHVVHSICSTRVVFLLRSQEQGYLDQKLPSWNTADGFSFARNDTELSTVLYR